MGLGSQFTTYTRTSSSVKKKERKKLYSYFEDTVWDTDTDTDTDTYPPTAIWKQTRVKEFLKISPANYESTK